ncbi:MAG TPA: hypothetical protein VGM36_13050 [Rhizomicrobium sp.]
MAAKSVTITLTSHPLSREENGVIFDVKEGSARAGQLVVSKGGLRWKPKGKQDHHHANWKEFEKFMLTLPKS